MRVFNSYTGSQRSGRFVRLSHERNVIDSLRLRLRQSESAQEADPDVCNEGDKTPVRLCKIWFIWIEREREKQEEEENRARLFVDTDIFVQNNY